MKPFCICGRDHSQDERQPTRTPAQCNICKRWFHPAKYAPMAAPNQWVCYECEIGAKGEFSE